MRALAIMAGLCLLLATAPMDLAGAAGMYNPGKEDCACPSLVAEGTIPDTLNTLADIPRALRLAELVERVGEEIRNMLQQFGVQTAQAEATAAPEPPPPVEKSAVEKPAEKAPKEKVTKPPKEKKVKRPPAKI